MIFLLLRDILEQDIDEYKMPLWFFNFQFFLTHFKKSTEIVKYKRCIFKSLYLT
jgi:hypothetical protein